jgi:DNA-3-methyladenine glycosylase II
MEATDRRVLLIEGQPFEMAVQQHGDAERSILRARLHGEHPTAHAKARAKSLLEKMLGLRVELSRLYASARRNKRIAGLVEEFRGLIPPRFPFVFETVVNGIAC